MEKTPKDSGENPSGDTSSVARLIDEYRDNLFCRWAIILEITTKEKVEEVLQRFERRELKGIRTSLRELFNEIGIDKRQMGLLLAVKAYMKQLEEDKKFGNIAIRNGFVSKEVVRTTLAIQMAEFKRDRKSTKLGDMLVERGEMTEEQRDEVLVIQSRKEPSLRTVVKDVKKNEAKVEERLDRVLELLVAADRMAAWLVVREAVPEDILPEQILSWLYGKKIKFGIFTERVEQVAGAKTLGKRIKIAEGQLPVPGKESAIRYHFDTGFMDAGGGQPAGEEGGGRAIPSVKAGSLLAVRTGAVQGKAGVTVLGKQVPPEPVPDIHLWSGNGVYSPDRDHFYAEIAGMPRLSRNRTLSVEPEYQILGDVDKENGDIRFENDVHITGTIGGGVKISCHNLKAREIRDAEIEVTGNVSVTRGITGAKITAMGRGGFQSGEEADSGNIGARLVRDTEIRAAGNLTVEKEVRGCRIALSGACRVVSSGYSMEGKIVGSEISAMGGIGSVDIIEAGKRACTLAVGVDVNFEEKVVRTRKSLAVSRELMEQLTGNLEKFRSEMEGTTEEVTRISAGLHQMSAERDRLEQAIARHLESGDKERAAHDEQVLSELEAKSQAAMEALGSLTEKEVRQAARVEKVAGQIRRVEEEVEHMSRWLDPETPRPEGRAVVEAAGEMAAGTVIRGARSETTLARGLRRVRIEEAQAGPDKWEMRAVRWVSGS